MAVTAKMVKELRDMTGAGMMDCKKALTEADADMEKAVDLLREWGVAKVAKKAGRATNEGTVMAVVAEDGKSGVVIELNCETDFVANTPEFKEMVSGIAQQIVRGNPADVDALMAQAFVDDSSKTISDLDESMKKVADIGYKHIQLSGVCAYEADWMAERLAAYGLQADITHFDYNRIIKDTDNTIAFHDTMGCKYIGIQPDLYDNNEEQVKAYLRGE